MWYTATKARSCRTEGSVRMGCDGGKSGVRRKMGAKLWGTDAMIVDNRPGAEGLAPIGMIGAVPLVVVVNAASRSS